MWPASSKTKTSFAPLDFGFAALDDVLDGAEAAGAVVELLEDVLAPDELDVADWLDVDALVWAVAEACGFCAAAPVLDALAVVLLECAPEPAPGLPDVPVPLPDALAPAAEFAGLVELSAGFVLATDSAGFGDVVLCD